jgi:LemA protein
MGATLLWASIIVLAIVTAIVYLITAYNRLVQLRNNLDKAWANIDVLLKQRHTELPKLIETCKGYMQHEQKTLQAVTEARAAYARATTRVDKAQADNLITGALRTMFAVAENYPELKASANFRQLQRRITELEEKIAGQRTRYNENVNAFTIRIARIPDVLVARMMSLQPHPLLQVAVADHEDVKVKFK